MSETTEGQAEFRQSLLDAGFVRSMDIQFPYEFYLAEQESETVPVLLFDASRSQYCVTDGQLMFIYFNAETPQEAVNWATRITIFEPNF